jgi:hypothetical protein
MRKRDFAKSGRLAAHGRVMCLVLGIYDQHKHFAHKANHRPMSRSAAHCFRRLQTQFDHSHLRKGIAHIVKIV